MADHGREKPASITILGNGNWGTTIGKLVANNIVQFPTQFNRTVRMYTYEEQVNGRNISNIINETHVNTKYLDGISLPHNLVAVPDIHEACRDTNILFVVLPFQFVKGILMKIKGIVSPDLYCITLSKGVYYDAENKGLQLLSQIVKDTLGSPCYSLMGANIANEVASEHLCETTVGCDNLKHYKELSNILKNENFIVQNSKDSVPVEMFGALKNIYAFGYGLLSEVKNVTPCSLVVLLRMAMIEMLIFIKDYCSKTNIECHELMKLTLHSCSYSDLIASSMGGRNARMGRLFSKDFYEKGKSKSVAEYEEENLNGQKIQGTLTADECFKYLEATNQSDSYPIMTTIHKIASHSMKPHDLLDAIRKFQYSPHDI